MDVQAVADASSASAPIVYPTLPPAPPPQQPVPQAQSGPVPGDITSRGTGVAPVQSAAPVASAGIDQAAKSAAAVRENHSLAPAIAKLFNAAEENVEVSFRVEKDPNEIVTVFTDRSTGKQIIQFPSQALVALAQYFNKLAGAVLDKQV